MSDSDGPNPAPPDSEVLARIDAQLGQLIPEVKKLRRSRWLVRGLAALVVAVVAIGAGGWITYQNNEDEDRALRQEIARQAETARRDLAASFEAALVAECDKANDSNADTRTGFNVLIDVGIDPNDPDQVAVARQFQAQLNEAIPPRDCPQEARDRAAGG